MNFKIDTKEKMHVINVQEDALTENMTEEIRELLLPYLNEPVKNIVIKLKQVKNMDDAIAITFGSIQKDFYDAGNSMVICEMGKEIQKDLDDKDLLDALNITPTESEAWDIVQMEEIEREFL